MGDYNTWSMAGSLDGKGKPSAILLDDMEAAILQGASQGQSE